MLERKYFTPKEFKKACQLANDIYSLSVVLDNYCHHNSDDEDISNVIPLVKFIRQQADELGFLFCNIDMNISGDNLEINLN